jgi:hypothetical protein
MRRQFFRVAEHAFDDVSALIGSAIDRVWRAPRGGGGDGCSDLPMLEPSAQTVGVVGLVRQHALWLSDGAEKGNGHDDVGDVSGRQRESDWCRSAVSRSIGPAADRSIKSWILRGAISRTRGLSAASVSACIAVVRPPRERATPSVNASFSASRRTVRFDVRARLRLCRSRWWCRFPLILLKNLLFWCQYLGFVASARKISGSPPYVAKIGAG